MTLTLIFLTLCHIYLVISPCTNPCANSYCFDDGSGPQCRSCPAECDCSNHIYCFVCQPGYTRSQDSNANYICGNCGDNCDCSSSSSTPCQTCLANYYRIYDSNSDYMCVSCGYNCDCGSGVYCEVCANNFYRITNSDNNYQCTTCPDQCDCTSGVYCQGCQLGYYRTNDGQGNYICGSTCGSGCDCSVLIRCSSCDSNWYIRNIQHGNYQCQNCPDRCICSNNTYCNECELGYYRYTDPSGNFDCTDCANFTTINSDIGQSYCANCQGKVYFPGNNTCIEICGDGIAQGNYQCDLGTGTEWNGCSDTCEVQDNFTCQINSDQSQSICSYTGQYNYTFINYTKELFQNKVTLQFKVYPPLFMFTQVDPNDFMRLDNADASSFAYDSQSDLFSVTFSYSSDISKHYIQFSLNGSTQADERFYAAEASQWNISIATNQDFPFLYYTTQQYAFSQAIFYLSYVLAILALVSFVLGIFAPNRLSSLQAIFVVQYAFISLMWFPKDLALPFYCLINLKYSTAYNYPFLQSAAGTSPSQFYTLGLSASSFYSNVNFCCTVFVIAWIGLAISRVHLSLKGKKIMEERKSLKDTYTKDYDEIVRLSKEDERLKQKEEKLEMRFEFFCELTLYLVMFNLSYLVACSVAFYIYGNQEDLASFILSAFLLLNSLITIIMYLKFNIYFQRFRYTFRPSTLTFHHYIFHALCIVLSVAPMIVLKGYPWIPFISQFLLFIYTAIHKPYNYLQENIRSCFNLLVMMATTSMVVFGFYIDDEAYISWNSYIYPIVIEVLLFVVVVWGIVITLQDIILDYLKRQKKNLSYDIFDDQKAVKQLQKKIIESNMTARNVLLSNIKENYQSTGSERDKKEYRVKYEKEKKENKQEKLTEEQTKIKLREILRENDLPETEQAVNELIQEISFLKFQKIIRQKGKKYVQPANKQKLVEYYNIKMPEN